MEASYRIVSLEEYRRGIAPLYSQDHPELGVTEIPGWVNHYGSVRYVGRQVFDRTIVLPMAASVRGVDVAWTAPYNLSDTVVRARTLWCHPDHRGRGISRGLLEYALRQWPRPWRTCVVFALEGAQPFYQRCGFEVVGEPRRAILPFEADPSEARLVYTMTKGFNHSH